MRGRGGEEEDWRIYFSKIFLVENPSACSTIFYRGVIRRNYYDFDLLTVFYTF